MFKDLCSYCPDYDEELECVFEPGNLSDPYVVAVKRFLELQLLLDMF